MAAFRTVSRSPDRANAVVWLTGPRIDTQTVPAACEPTGPGPATPVVAIAQVVPKVRLLFWAPYTLKRTLDLYKR